MEPLLEAIRDIPDFPKPGIQYKDITPLLQSPKHFKLAIESMAKLVEKWTVTQIVAIESRGFIFGAPLARELNVGLSIVRKPNKLPYRTHEVEYALEYGTDKLEIHQDALVKTDSALIVDDILATGGTAQATAKLTEALGAKVAGFCFLGELEILNGRQRLEAYPVESVLKL